MSVSEGEIIVVASMQPRILWMYQIDKITSKIIREQMLRLKILTTVVMDEPSGEKKTIVVDSKGNAIGLAKWLELRDACCDVVGIRDYDEYVSDRLSKSHAYKKWKKDLLTYQKTKGTN